MNILIKMAWRSLWRNKRRTLITATSIVLALVLALFMRSMQYGSYATMIDAGVNDVGNLQVHDTGYWNNQTIDRAFFSDEVSREKIKALSGVNNVLPHLTTFVLSSFGDRTKGLLLTGILPDEENNQIHLQKKVIKGSYLKTSEDGILIGDKTAEYLKIKVGDSLVIMGQGYQGTTAIGIFPVVGIAHYVSPQMNNLQAYMPLTTMQKLIFPYREGILTGYAVYTDTKYEAEVEQQIKSIVGNHYEVISWKVMLSDMLQSIKLDNVSGMIMLMILYVIVAFGIFSTVLMMTVERRRQYAVMISVGMKKEKLVLMSIFESILIALLGIIVGLIIVTPVLIYLYLNPIPLSGEMASMYESFNIEPVIKFSIAPKIFVSQTLIVLLLSLISALYPTFYILRFNVLNALRQ